MKIKLSVFLAALSVTVCVSSQNDMDLQTTELITSQSATLSSRLSKVEGMLFGSAIGDIFESSFQVIKKKHANVAIDRPVPLSQLLLSNPGEGRSVCGLP